jgi:TaqI-like C-terminal specificity domain/Eco57I restriction-modification methylase
VTKLSLLLKVLEGETDQTLQPLLFGLHERALPDLGNNIKCGNSLIGPDLYEQGELVLDDEERFRINVFNWQSKDGFPEIMKAGGFDAVIGNPPYIFTRELLTNAERTYFSNHYALSWEKHNTFLLFMEAQLRLLNERGRGSFIVPNSWLTIESGRLIRKPFIERLNVIADLNYLVFPKVSMEPCIFVITGGKSIAPVQVLRARSKEEFLHSILTPADRKQWFGSGDRIVIAGSNTLAKVLERVRRASKDLSSIFEVRTGLQAYEKGKGTPRQTANDVKDHIYDRREKVDDTTYCYLEGKDVGRFQLNWSGTWLRYGPWLSQPRELSIFTRPRILVREITAPVPYCLHSTYVDKRFLNNKSILNVLHPEDDHEMLKALTCVLNSKLMSVYYKTYAVKGARTVFPKVVIKNLREFPIPKEFGTQEFRKLAGLADIMIDCHHRLDRQRTPHEQAIVKRQIEDADRQINLIVYKLYGLADEEEIRTVEVHSSLKESTAA